MIRILKVMLFICLSASLTGCFTVKKVDNPEDKRCNLVTKELELNYSKDLTQKMGSGTDPRAVLPLLVVVPPISFIVSGSVTVVGNAVHWIEKQGRCDDEEVTSFTNEHNEAVINKGGEVVETSDSFADWLKNRK